MVEFAIIITVLMLIFLGIVDYGRFMYYQVSLQNAARQGAEAASNHCLVQGNCGTTTGATSDALVMWSAACEAKPYVTLQPAFTACMAGTASTWTPSCVTTCTPCTSDICVSPTTRSSGTQVTVTVGYNFKPITPLMAPFFHDQACFALDDPTTNHHTLCASSIGKVS